MGASVSIIIPVFNAQKTIDETLASIKVEIVNSPEISWEVIAINDGSTDGSAEVLKSWQSQLPLKTFTLGHTGGPASPRNLGIQEATSEFVFFLDSDDVLIRGGLLAAVEYAIANDSDVVLPRLASLDGRGVPRGMYSKNQPDVDLENSRIYWALNPMKLIRRSLLVENDIKFNAELSVGEDQPFSALAYLNAEKISVLSNPPAVGVRYTKSATNITLQVKPASAYFELLDTMAQIISNSKLNDEAKQFIWIRHWEIEIARELVWNSLAMQDSGEWLDVLKKLYGLASLNISPGMLPKTSIRWRGIVGLIGSANYPDLEKLVKGRKLVLENRSWISKYRGVLLSNWIRFKSTIFLPKNF
jgi:glycosyltransferase involved in cell wall biosynthesis